jgi:hypothetical protein
MNFKKVIAGGLAGGIVFFFLGWVIYGMLLADFMSVNHSLPAPRNIDRAMPLLHYLFVGNLFLGFLIAFVFDKANVKTVQEGMTTGAYFGLLLGVGLDFMMYGLTTLMNLKMVAVDIAVSVIMYAVIGAVVAFVLSKMNK